MILDNILKSLIVDIHIIDKDTQLVIEKSKAFRYVMLWSEPGQDYVCIEPWTAKKNEYNEKKELIYVERDHPFEVEISMSLERC